MISNHSQETKVELLKEVSRIVQDDSLRHGEVAREERDLKFDVLGSKFRTLQPSVFSLQPSAFSPRPSRLSVVRQRAI